MADNKKNSDGIVVVRIGDLKSDWLEVCKRRNTTSSLLMREFIQNQIKEENIEDANGSAFVVRPNNRRITFRVSDEVYALLVELAKRDGFKTLNRWVAAAMTSKTKNFPQPTADEFYELVIANRALSAIGRNLNQLVIDARSSKSSLPDYRFTVFDKLREQLNGHQETIRNVLAANITRWT